MGAIGWQLAGQSTRLAAETSVIFVSAEFGFDDQTAVGEERIVRTARVHVNSYHTISTVNYQSINQTIKQSNNQTIKQTIKQIIKQIIKQTIIFTGLIPVRFMIQLVGNFEFTFDSQSDLTDGTANQVNGLARVSSRIVAISSANHQRMIT